MTDLVTDAIRDPRDAYARLASRGRVIHDPATASWYVLDEVLVRELSRDTRLRARGVPAAVANEPPNSPVRPVEAFLARWLVFSDPPTQARVRRALAPALTRSALAGPLAGLTDRAAEIGARAAAHGGDVVRNVALPLSRITTAALLEVDADELSALERCSDALIGYLATPGTDRVAAARALPEIDRLHRLVIDVLLPRGGRVADVLYASRSGADPLDDDDVVAAYAQLLTGAMEPLTSALVTVMALAVTRPDEPHDLLVDSALAEEPPFHFAPRVAVENLTVGDVVVPAGDRVVLTLFAASRQALARCPVDAAPDHVSFGAGTHYCLGAAATRLHLARALEGLAGTGLLTRLNPAGLTRRAVFGASSYAAWPMSPAVAS